MNKQTTSHPEGFKKFLKKRGVSENTIMSANSGLLRPVLRSKTAAMRS